MSEESRAIGKTSRRRSTAVVAAITRACWVFVLVLTATFHFIRGAPVDAWIYLGGAAVVGLDALGWLRIPLRPRSYGPGFSRRVLAFTLIGVASLVMAATPLYGAVDAVVVVGLGVLLLPVVWADRVPGPRDAPSSRRVRRAAVAWSIVIVAGCAWEIAAFFLSRISPAAEQQFPPLSDLIDPLLATPVTRALLVAAWFIGGYALLRRGYRS